MSIDVQLQKDFGSFRLDVSFRAGSEVLALLGGSGCGKSMTLRCIAGIVKPDAGHIIVDGVTFFDSEKKIDLSPQQRRVGLLFQNYALFNNMTVTENLMAGVREKRPKGEKRELAEAFLKTFHLQGLENRLPRELSGGQQQRVALARILIGRPRILMLDEPFSALDSYLKWEMELELRRTLAAFSGTTILVTHSRDEVYRMARQVCVIDHGTSEPVQTVQELFERPATQAAALLSGCKNYARCEKRNADTVYVTDWDLTLRCGRPVPEETRLLGVRRHFVHPTKETGENTFPCTVAQVIDDVFSTIVLLRPDGAAEDALYPILELELGKKEWAAQNLRVGSRLRVAIAPEDILLLH